MVPNRATHHKDENIYQNNKSIKNTKKVTYSCLTHFSTMFPSHHIETSYVINFFCNAVGFHMMGMRSFV